MKAILRHKSIHAPTTSTKLTASACLRDGAWYPEALVLRDSATGSNRIGTPIFDKQAYLMKDEDEVQALK